MNTAKDFAAAASYISQMAEKMNPSDTDPYAQSRKLAVFHLRRAARITFEIAEVKARMEETAP